MKPTAAMLADCLLGKTRNYSDAEFMCCGVTVENTYFDTSLWCNQNHVIRHGKKFCVLLNSKARFIYGHKGMPGSGWFWFNRRKIRLVLFVLVGRNKLLFPVDKRLDS